jgi:predicted nuclease of predicted toxin-antitoxin system
VTPPGTPLASPRLLFDENLAAGLVRRLADVYPDSAHVKHVGLERQPDAAIWERAAAEGFVIVTKDDDFRAWCFLRGAPPQVVWLRLGNCSTDDVERVLRSRLADVRAFCADPAAALLVLNHGT